MWDPQAKVDRIHHHPGPGEPFSQLQLYFNDSLLCLACPNVHLIFIILISPQQSYYWKHFGSNFSVGI